MQITVAYLLKEGWWRGILLLSLVTCDVCAANSKYEWEYNVLRRRCWTLSETTAICLGIVRILSISYHDFDQLMIK